MDQWEQFVTINDIGPKFQKASFIESDKIMPAKRKQFGLDWCKHHPKQSLMLIGSTGLGKTYFMNCLIRKLLENVHISDIRYYKSKILDDRMLAEIREYQNCSYTIRCACEIPFLFIDDLGMERYSERVERDYYEIIDTRLEHEKPTVINTNLDDEEMKKVYGIRIGSRFKTYKWIKFEGEDIRGMNKAKEMAVKAI